MIRWKRRKTMNTDSGCNSSTPSKSNNNNSNNSNNSNKNHNNDHHHLIDLQNETNNDQNNKERMEPSMVMNNFKTTTCATNNVHTSLSRPSSPSSSFSATILPPLSSLHLLSQVSTECASTTTNQSERVPQDHRIQVLNADEYGSNNKWILTNSKAHVREMPPPASPLSTQSSKESTRSLASSSSDDPNKIQTCTLQNLPTIDSMDGNTTLKNQLFKEQFKKYVTQYKRRYKKVVISKTPEQQKTILTKLLNFQGGQFFANLQNTSKNQMVIQACMQEGDQLLDLAVLVTRKRFSAKPKLEDFSFNMVVLSNPTSTTSSQFLPRTPVAKNLSSDNTNSGSVGQQSKPTSSSISSNEAPMQKR